MILVADSYGREKDEKIVICELFIGLKHTKTNRSSKKIIRDRKITVYVGMSIDSSSKFWVSELEKRWTRIEDGTITIAATGAEEAPTRDMRVGMPVVVERVVEQRDWRLDDD